MLTAVECIRSASDAELDRLVEIWEVARFLGPEPDAWVAADLAAGEAAWGWDRDRQRVAAWSDAKSASGRRLSSALTDPARTAVLHDVVGTYGYTAEHERLLMGPFAQAFGWPWPATHGAGRP